MIRIRTLGSLTVTRDGTVVSGTGMQARRLGVLALVARAGLRGITRERLLALLWPDGEEQASRAALSQALHALRRDMGSDEAFLGVQTLRLNEAIATCDVVEFEAAIADGDWTRAAAAYGGPFLEGLRVAGAPEFERWVEEERGHLAQRHAEAVERLAKEALARGDAPEAVRWWRRRASIDPLNARVTVELMRALDASGDRGAALQQARVYEALVAEELSLPPDAEVVRYAEALKSGAEPVPVRAAGETAGRQGGRTAGETAEQDGTTARRPGGARELKDGTAAEQAVGRTAGRQDGRMGRRWVLLAGLGVVVAIVVVAALREPRRSSVTPLLAVGGIEDHRAASPGQAFPAAEMLTSSLARVSGIQVLSRIRVLELVDRRGGEAGSAADLAGAARAAGATELLQGGIHALPDGRLLLELQRVDLASGTLRTAYRLEGQDALDLVERATAEVAASLGRSAGAGERSSTASLVAYRFYEEGLQRYARGDYRGARGLFDAALKEDSTFAMAAFYRFRAGAPIGIGAEPGEVPRLRALANQASDRERLLILGTLAAGSRDPEFRAIADTFVVRYPTEADAQWLAGYARLGSGEPAEALPYLHRVVELDSAALGSGRGRCMACDALQQLGYAYIAMDSLVRAEELVRDWTRRAPESAVAWAALSAVLNSADRYEEALAARSRAPVPYDDYDAVYPAIIRLRAGDFAASDRSTRALIADAAIPTAAWEAYWLLAISLRYQERWDEAIALMRSYLARVPAGRRQDYVSGVADMEALSFLESGRAAEAARIWDSLTTHPDPRQGRGDRARYMTMHYLLLTEATATAGDLAGVTRAADSTRAWASRIGGRRDLCLAEHANGLVALAGRDTTSAIAAFRRAIWSPTLGFTRTNYRLAGLLLAQDKPEEAVPLLRAALRGSLEGGNLYVTHTELHGMLARGFEALGQADSARVHREWGQPGREGAGRSGK